MPRVSEAHLAARRHQILDAARVCFLRSGFHQTSMQDVIKQANLSVGAVYRYFPSKTELIAALAGQVISRISAMFDTMAREDPPLSIANAMQRGVDLVNDNTGPDGMLRLALQVWSEALHDPALGEFVKATYEGIRQSLITVAVRAKESGELPAEADPVAVGSVLFALLPGYALQRILVGGPEPEIFKAGLRTLLGSTASVGTGDRVEL